MRLLRKNLGILDEVVPFDGVKLLEVFEERNTGVLVLLANDFTKGQKDLDGLNKHNVYT